MGHLKNMTEGQRLKFFSWSYKTMLESRRGHNYEYWSEKHDELLENGWKMFEFKHRAEASSSENIAKNKVDELRQSGHYARIVCGLQKNVQRIKMYSIIYKLRRGF
jgi:hypothetical protein